MLSGRVRVGLLMDLIHSSLCDRIRDMPGIRDDLTGQQRDEFDEDGHLDAAGILLVAKKRASSLTSRPNDIKEAAQTLYKVRRFWAHQRPLPDELVIQAIAAAGTMFVQLDMLDAARSAESLLAEFDDSDIGRLRVLLIERLNRVDPLITYGELLAALGWDDLDASRSRLFRALNGLGGWQRALGEPVLSALVVLSKDEAPTPGEAGIPGRGFYWLVNEERNAPLKRKQLAHAKEVRRIRAHKWS